MAPTFVADASGVAGFQKLQIKSIFKVKFTNKGKILSQLRQTFPTNKLSVATSDKTGF